VSGIFESGKLSHICARLSVLQALTGNPGRLSQIYVKVDDPARVQLVVEQLRGKMPGYFIYTIDVLRKNSSANRKTQKWHDLNGIEDTAAEHAFAVPI